MTAALREVMQELAGDVRVRLAIVVGEEGVVGQAGRESSDRQLVNELAQAAWVVQEGLGVQADSTTMTFDTGVVLFLNAGRATVAALGTDSVFLVYVEAVWQRRKSQLIRALPALSRGATASENATVERVTTSAVAPPAAPSFGSTASTNAALPPTAPSPAIPNNARGPDLAALLRSVEALFVEYRQRDGVPPRRSIQHFSELVAEWHSICDPAIYTFPLLLDSVTQVVSRDPAQKARFSGEVQGLLVPGGLERRVP